MKILGFTGSRADYFLQRPLFTALQSHADIELSLIVSGGILEEADKSTLKSIESDSFSICGIVPVEDINDETHLSAISSLLKDLPRLISNFNPDLCIVYADRYESFAYALACFHLGQVLLHVEAGDLTYGGTFDDSIRHAISHISHLYSVTTRSSYEVLINFGISEARIQHTGLLSYDNINSLTLDSAEAILGRLNLRPDIPLILATFHPIPRNPELTHIESQTFFSALSKCSDLANIIITSPNHDGGRNKILQEIHSLLPHPRIRYVESLGASKYYSLMSYSSKVPVIVAGNSSSIIKEAPYFNAHSLNVGVRQSGRVAAPSQINVAAKSEEIVTVLSRLCLQPCLPVQNPYYRENPSQELARFIREKLTSINKNDLLSNNINPGEVKDISP